MDLCIVYALLFNESSVHVHLYSRIWNTSDGQCLKTLAEGHNAIWYVFLIHISLFSFNELGNRIQANTFNFRQIQNIFSLLHTIVLSVFGITRPHGV